MPPHRLKSGRRCRPHTNNNQTSLGGKSLMTEQCAQPPACRGEWRAGRWAILPCLARLATPGAAQGTEDPRGGEGSESHAHSQDWRDWALVFRASSSALQEDRSNGARKYIVHAALPCLLHTMEQLLTQHNGLGATNTTTYTYTPFVGRQARRQKVGMA